MEGSSSNEISWNSSIYKPEEVQREWRKNVAKEIHLFTYTRNKENMIDSFSKLPRREERNYAR